MTTRGLKTNDCNTIVEMIDRAIQIALKIEEKKLVDFKNKINLKIENNENEIIQLQKDVILFTNQFPYLNNI